MDGLIVIIICLSLIFLALSLRSFYNYLILKEELEEEIKEKTFIYNVFEKKVTRKDKVISKMLHYADDFSAIGQRINFYSENQDVQKLLMQAGFPYQLTVERFQGLKIFLTVVGLIIGGISLVLRLPLQRLPLFYFLLPVIWGQFFG